MMLAVFLLAAGASAQNAGPVAGSVVQSKEWRVKRSPNDKEEEFIGDVRYNSGPDAFKSDWALFKHASQLWRARGRVQVERALAEGGLVQAQGDEARYSQKTRQGELTAKRQVLYKHVPPQGEPDEGAADRMEWTGRERVVLRGNVHAWGPRLETWSDDAAYDRVNGRLDLSGGRPVLRKFPWDAGDWTGAVKADRIVAFENPRRIEADGQTQGWIDFKRQSQAASR